MKKNHLLLTTLFMLLGVWGLLAQSPLCGVAGTNGQAGTFFEVEAASNIVITSLDGDFDAVSCNIQLWTRAGSHIGFEGSNAGWTLLGTATIVGGGIGNPVPLPIALNVPVSAGNRQAFHLVSTNNTAQNYATGTGTVGVTVVSSTAELTLFAGCGSTGLFGGCSFSPRNFMGCVNYQTATPPPPPAADITHPFNTTVNFEVTCGTALTNYYDNGGAGCDGTGGEYLNNSNGVAIICPDAVNAGQPITLEFLDVDIETRTTAPCWDFLNIYDGIGTGAPQLFSGCGEEGFDTCAGGFPGDGGDGGGVEGGVNDINASASNTPANTNNVWTSSDASGCLTVEFTSDTSVQEGGWIATLGCDQATLPGCNIVCPATISVPCEGGADPAITGTPITGVDCVLTYSDETVGCVITRTWTSTSQTGASSSCVQTIILIDNTAPTVTCPAGQTLTCFETVPAPATTAAGFVALGGSITDNCTTDLADFTVFSQDANNGGNNCPGNARTVTRTYYIVDACSNTSTCTQTFTYLASNQGPVITSVLPTCYKYCESLLNPAATDVTYTTDCSFGAVVNVTGPTQIGATNCPGTIYRFTYSVTDDCGRTSAPVTRDFVIGNDGPSITCPPFNLILECGDPNNAQYIEDHFGTVDANTSCELGYTLTHFPTNFNNIACGSSTVVTFVATDACGRTASCTTTVAIQDNTPPTIISVPPPVCDVIECGADANFWFNHWINYIKDGIVAEDQCDSDVSITHSGSLNQNCNANGVAVSTVTFSVNDNCGNSSTYVGNFTIQNTAPALFQNIPADQVIQCGGPVVFGPAPTVAEQCQTTVTFADTVDDTDPCNVINTRTWTATDACGGLTTSVSQTITVVDDEAPVAPAAPADVNVQCADDVPPPVELTATDNCAGDITVSPSAVITPGNCDNQFTMVRTWTFVDDCGNTSSVSQTITVNDTTPPDAPAAPADVTVQCADDVPPPVELTATDNCDGDITVSPSAVITPGNCDDQFTEVRTWTFVDGCGNTSSVSQTITVNDDTAPTFTFVPADYETRCIVDGNSTAYAQICASSDDAEEDCDTGEMDLMSSDLEMSQDESQNKFVEVGLRFKDLHIPAGATITGAYIQFTVDATIGYDPSEVTVKGEDSDNASTFTLEDDNISDRPRTFASANWEPADWEVIGDNKAAQRTPDLSSIVQEIVNRGGYTSESALAFFIKGIGKRTAISWDGNPEQAPELYVTYEASADFGTPTAEDNCSNVTITFVDTEVGGCEGSKTRTWTATDGCGNTSTASQTITFTGDNVPPVFTFVPDHVNTSCDETPFPPTFGTPVAEDNCGGPVTITFFDYFDTGDENSCDEDDEDWDYRRRWTATDECGNTTTAEQRFNVKDSYSLSGKVYTEVNENVEDVQVTLEGIGGFSMMSQTQADGAYGFDAVEANQNYTITPALDENPLNGVSSYDLVLISKHILQTEFLDSPYKMIAADINRSGSITTMDLVELRKLILHVDETFANNTSWRFVHADFIFPVYNNPFATVFPEEAFINGLQIDEIHDFIGVKVGDVNGSAIANGFTGADDRTFVGDLVFNTKDQQLKAGQSYAVDFYADNFNALHGYQYTLNFDPSALAFESLNPGTLTGMSENNFGLTLLDQGVITTSWTNQEAQSLNRDARVFTVTFTAQADAMLSEVLSIGSRYTKAEAYNADLDLMDVTLRFDESTVAGKEYRLYQNTPNPFRQETVIGFDLPADMHASLSIFDASGRQLKMVEGDFVKGYNQVTISRNEFTATGVLYYQLVTADYEQTMKMIIAD